MSIIIRLQNLPWAANSVDIRRYFAGLSIPEGGVHIVGGEKGDAFIAFSTDEDARLAMEKDGGKIKDMKVKLLLSSRTEMMRVIEQARNQNLALQTPAAVKAAVNDSDRRKIRERSPSPPRRKDRDKSPVRDRRRSSTKRERTRSRSRSPVRRSRDRDRDSDRRSDRSKRDDRRLDDSQRSKDERSKSSRDFNSRDSSQEKKTPFAGIDSSQPPSNNSTQNMGMNQNKSYDPRMGATPQQFDSRLLEGSRTGLPFDSRQANFPGGNLPYFDPRNMSVPSAAAYNFPSAVNPSSTHPEQKSNNEPLLPPSFNTSISFPPPFDKRMAANNSPASVSTNYEAKRPSPTPATSAPNVGSNAQFVKAFGLPTHPDAYEKMMNMQSNAREAAYTKPSNFGNHQDTATATYSTAQTADRGTIPAVPHDRNSISSNQPIISTPPYGQKAVYGAESHARYEQIPEANQATRSTTPSRPSSQPNETLYGKRLPPNIPTVTSPTTGTTNKPPRRSRFEPEHAPPPQPENQFYMSNTTKNEVKPQMSLHRPAETDHSSHYDKSVNQPHTREDKAVPPPHDGAFPGSQGSWSRPSHPDNGSWNEGRHGLLAPPHPSTKSNDYPQVIPMDLDEDSLPQSTPSPTRPDVPHNNRMMHPRGPLLCPDNQRPDIYEMEQPRIKREPLINEPRNAGPLLNRNEPPNNRGPHGPPSLTVEVRGLAFDACEADVLELFRGLFIPPENIKLQRNSRGQPTGNALVKFVHLRDFEEGLSRHKQYIGNSCPEVIPCPTAVFENAPIANCVQRNENISFQPPHSKQLRPREEDLCIELSGLPYTCKEEDIVHFFDGLGILDIFIEQGPDGRSAGGGYVEFGTPPDFHASLAMTGKMIGPRYVTVTIASKEMMAVARGQVSERGPKELLFPQGPPREQLHPPPHPPKGSRPPPADSPTFCVALNGLSKVVKNRDIADFFREVNVTPRAIHIMLDPNNLPSGDAFAEFNTGREFEAALQRNDKFLAGVPISISPIPHWEMVDILGGPPSGPGAPPAPLLRNPPEKDRPPPRRPLMPKPPGPEDKMSMGEGRPPGDIPPEGFRPRALLEPRFPRHDMPHFEHLEPPMGGRPPFNRMRGPPRGGGVIRPPRPFRPDGPPRGPPLFRHRAPMPPRVGSPHNRVPKDFGMPGCVVAISNLHFRAGLEEILEFFQEFSLSKDSVIRKYNESGQATGEARVSFRCRDDAVRAVEELGQKSIMGRPVSLCLVL